MMFFIFYQLVNVCKAIWKWKGLGASLLGKYCEEKLIRFLTSISVRNIFQPKVEVGVQPSIDHAFGINGETRSAFSFFQLFNWCLVTVWVTIELYLRSLDSGLAHWTANPKVKCFDSTFATNWCHVLSQVSLPSLPNLFKIWKMATDAVLLLSNAYLRELLCETLQIKCCVHGFMVWYHLSFFIHLVTSNINKE